MGRSSWRGALPAGSGVNLFRDRARLTVFMNTGSLSTIDQLSPYKENTDPVRKLEDGRKNVMLVIAAVLLQTPPLNPA